MVVTMKLQEFLEELKAALEGEIPQNEVDANLRYYRDYIRLQEQTGKEEAEIINQLGDPRLIARTIIDTFRLNADPERRYEKSTEKWNTQYYGEANREEADPNTYSKVFHMPVWLVKVIVIAVLLLIVSVLFWIGGMAVKLFFKIGIPLILLYFVYIVIRNMFTKK